VKPVGNVGHTSASMGIQARASERSARAAPVGEPDCGEGVGTPYHEKWKKASARENYLLPSVVVQKNYVRISKIHSILPTQFDHAQGFLTLFSYSFR